MREMSVEVVQGYYVKEGSIQIDDHVSPEAFYHKSWAWVRSWYFLHLTLNFFVFSEHGVKLLIYFLTSDYR